MAKKSKPNKWFMLSSSFTGALGGFLFGFDTAVISGTIPYITKYFHLSDAMLGWAVSSALVGCIIGSMTIGKPGDIYGRRFMLKVLALLFLVSSIGTAVSTSVTVFAIFRFIGGLAIGGASVLSPMYISEIAQPKMRGRLVSVSQLAIVCGVLMTFVCNYLLVGTGENNWRWMFLAGAVPAAAFYIMLFFISQSPRWLVMVGKTEEAKQVIGRLNPGEDTVIELEDIKQSIKAEIVHMSILSLFKKPYLKLVLIGISIGAFGALVGVNTITYYAPTIFQSIGFSRESALFQAVCIGSINLVFTLIGMSLIDKIGRKSLMMAGAVGMSIFMFLIFLALKFGLFGNYALVAFVLGYQASFASTMGVVIWVLLSEMFPNNIRARALSLGSFSNWICNAIITYLFPVVAGFVNAIPGGSQQNLGYVFAFYSVVALVSFFFYWKYLVETKGKSLEELEKIVLSPD